MDEISVESDILRIEDEEYVHAASSFADDRTRVLKHGETFAVFDRYGDILAIGKREQGLYHRDTRFLSRSRLYLDGSRPLLLSSTISDDNALMTVDLANAPGGRDEAVHQEVVHVLRSRFLWDGACYERLQLQNFGPTVRTVVLEYEFGADFADIFEVRGHRPARRGRLRPPRVSGSQAVLAYEGLDGVVRTTRLSFRPAPARISDSRARFAFELVPGTPVVVDVTIECSERPGRGSRAVPFATALRESTAALRRAEAGCCGIATTNEQFNQWIRRALADLHMLLTDTPHGPYVYAGVPWFSTAFGRDGIITALEMLWVQPSIAAGVLRYLAATQARHFDPMTDAQPGKILHETRAGEMSATGEVPFAQYYGSVDATPLFVVLAGEYFRATGDLALIADIWPNIEQALAWMHGPGDADGDGFIEYSRESPGGLVNQGWKDSGDSIFHEDGSDAAGPIALCEVQGYAYAALTCAAELAAALGHRGRAAALLDEANTLRSLFDDAFWLEDLGTYALALDGGKRPCRVRTSNAGHCLFTGIALERRADRLADTLLSPAMFSGWGIRTVARGEARYNPMSYHNGSVWPHDNALIAAGLARYGHKQEAIQLLGALFDAAIFSDLHRLPELFCGFERRQRAGPTLYPVACSPQAWSAGAPFMILGALLGLQPDGRGEELRLAYPELPAFLDEVRLEGLQAGTSRLGIALRRYPTDVSITVTSREGPARVVVVK